MRNYRMDVGGSLKGKVDELRFFFSKILQTLDAIEHRCAANAFPLAPLPDELNFYFSAFLNSIQSLKDGLNTSMHIQLNWKDLSPTYGSFIQYGRNAATHDGAHLINAMQDGKSYITGPLRRIGLNNKIHKLHPPKEDVRTLVCSIVRELISSARDLLQKKGGEIPGPGKRNLRLGLWVAIRHPFIPKPIRKVIKQHKTDILASAQDINFDHAGKALEALSQLEMQLPPP